MEQNKRKHHIILVHGAGHGAWSWYKVATMLRSAGHRVTVPDLTASGIDAARAEDVSTVYDYSQPLTEIMASVSAEENVVLVGHSFGGISVAMAMERFPERVAVGIFVTALMPDCRRSIHDMIEQQRLDRNSAANELMMDNQICIEEMKEEKVVTSLLFGQQLLTSRLYQLSPPEDLTLATTLVRPFPVKLIIEHHASTISFSKDRYGSVDSVYILCCQDKCISEEFQRWMIQNHSVKEVVEIKGADHMPMFSTPQELCNSLLRILDGIN